MCLYERESCSLSQALSQALAVLIEKNFQIGLMLLISAFLSVATMDPLSLELALLRGIPRFLLIQERQDTWHYYSKKYINDKSSWNLVKTHTMSSVIITPTFEHCLFRLIEFSGRRGWRFKRSHIEKRPRKSMRVNKLWMLAMYSKSRQVTCRNRNNPECSPTFACRSSKLKIMSFTALTPVKDIVGNSGAKITLVGRQVFPRENMGLRGTFTLPAHSR